MTVQQELSSLEELQNLDLKNLEIRQNLKDIPINIEETQKNVGHVRLILDKEKARLDEAEAWHKDRLRDIDLQNEMLTKSKGKLQAARNEKENKAAQREIDTIRKNIQDREKEAIELMEAIEQYRIAIEEHTKEFGELEEHLRVTEEEGKAKIAEAEALIETTASNRKDLAAKVPQKILRLYERIHKRLGQALVEVIDGSCTGCNIGLLPQMYIELQRGDKMFQCPSCYRILMYKPISEEDADNS